MLSAASTPLFALVMVLLLSYFDSSHVPWVVPVLGAPLRNLRVHSHGSHSTSIICLNTLSLEFFNDLCSYRRKNLIYIKPRFCGSLKKTQPVLLRESSTSGRVDLFFIFRAICLVGNEQFLDIGDCVLVDLLEPVLYVIESDLLGTIVD